MTEATYYWNQLKNIRDKADINLQDLYSVFEELIYQLTEDVNISFSTFYVRLSYVFHSYPVPGHIQWLLYKLRHMVQHPPDEQTAADTASDQKERFHQAVALFVSLIYKEEVPPGTSFAGQIPENFGKTSGKYFTALRAVIQQADFNKKLLYAVSETIPGEVITIESEAPDLYAELFSPNDWLKFPYTISLVNVNVRDNGNYVPELIILEPDFLVDVTTVSEIAADPQNIAFHLLTKKFITQPVTSSLLEGHAANLFLDNLIKNPDAGFREIFTELFHTYPLVLAKYDDDMLKALYENCKLHYSSLKWITTSEFPKHEILPEGIFVEPSFINPQYGIQGRLDIFFRGNKNNQAIVELKSGKPFMENKYGLSRSHYFQTLLYDLLIKAVSKSDVKTSCFILYSKMGEQGLRYAPPIKAVQHDALRVRNKIYALEKQLATNGKIRELTEQLSNEQQNLKGFLSNHWKFFKNVLLNADETSLAYFYTCAAFISREHMIAKTGTDVSDRLTGQSSVWLESTSRKEDNFAIFKGLSIREVKLSNEEPLVVLYKSEATNKLASFRIGDIVILYPGHTQNPVSNQIFKCTIIELNGDKIVLRLRATQLNHEVFFNHSTWNIEPDMLDSSFNGLYRSIFDFLKSPEEKRKKILGLTSPVSADKDLTIPEYLIESQAVVYKRALQADDYFLIWGPPGTGKTSRLVRALAEYYYRNETRPLLIAAYTNRAADEICEAIECISTDIRMHYTRIGARYSTSPDYRPVLLENKLKKCSQRSEVLEVLKNQRIIVGTLASIRGKPELFDYYDFCCGIVDEASQVLEPAMAGLMSKLPKTILIGDHKQLPSIVTQSDRESRIQDAMLMNAGISNLADSLFERLFRRCLQMGWTSAYGMLTHQGRMHPDIAAFPNEMFYNGELQSMNTEGRQDILHDIRNHSEDGTKVFDRRIAFIHCDVPPDEVQLKTNTAEAKEVVKLIEQILAKIRDTARLTIGVITPFRAQIALLKSMLEEEKIPSDNITIDTVERYQGGARDIIILSLCANKKSALKSITSINKEGIDRKLNVALTRAREQIVIFGNKEILNQNPGYASLISEYEVTEGN